MYLVFPAVTHGYLTFWQQGPAHFLLLQRGTRRKRERRGKGRKGAQNNANKKPIEQTSKLKTQHRRRERRGKGRKGAQNNANKKPIEQTSRLKTQATNNSPKAKIHCNIEEPAKPIERCVERRG